MNPMLQAALGSIIRAVLMAGAVRLVDRGVWTQGDAASYVSAATLAILSLAWSQRVVFQNRVRFLVALMLPHGATENEVTAVIKSGAVTPSVTTPPDTIPGVPKP